MNSLAEKAEDFLCLRFGSAPEVMVLDEPTSNLDVHAIEELKQTLLGWKAEGKTIVIAEHRLSWLRDLCDRVICMKDGQVAFDLSMQAFAQHSTEQLHQMGLRSLRDEKIAPVQNSVPETETMQLQNFCFSYDGTPVAEYPHLSLPLDGIIALVGPNGAGKSTFSRCLCGLEKKFKGQVQDKRTALEKQTAAEKLLHGHAGCEPPTVLRNSS